MIKAVFLSIFFLLPVFGKASSDCLSFKAALFTQTIRLLETQKEWKRVAANYEKAFEDHYHCQQSLLACHQLKEELDRKTTALIQAERMLEQVAEERKKAFKEYHQCIEE